MQAVGSPAEDARQVVDDTNRWTAVEDELKGLLAGISDAMIDEIAATGSQEEVAGALESFVRAGCTMPVVGVAGGYEGYEGAEAALASLRTASALVG